MYEIYLEILENRKVVLKEKKAGNQGENNSTMLIISIPQKYSSYFKYVDIMKEDGEKIQMLLSNKEENKMKFLIPYELTLEYALIMQVVLKKENLSFISNIFSLQFDESILVTDFYESEYKDVLEALNENKADKEELYELSKLLENKVDIKNFESVFNELDRKAFKTDISDFIKEGVNTKIVRNGNEITINSIDSKFGLTPYLKFVLCDGINDHLKIQEAIDSITDTNIPTTIMPIGNCVINGVGIATNVINLKPNMTLDGQFCKMIFDCEATGGTEFEKPIFYGNGNVTIKNINISATNITYEIYSLISLHNLSHLLNCNISNFTVTAFPSVGSINMDCSCIKDCYFENIDFSVGGGPLIYAVGGNIESCYFANSKGNTSNYAIQTMHTNILNNQFINIKIAGIIHATDSKVFQNVVRDIEVENEYTLTLINGANSELISNTIRNIDFKVAVTVVGFRASTGTVLRDNKIEYCMVTTTSFCSATFRGYHIIDENVKLINNIFNNKGCPNNYGGNELNEQPFISNATRSLISGNTAIFEPTGTFWDIGTLPFKAMGKNCVVENNFTNFITIGTISGEGTIAKDNIATGEVVPNA